MKEYHRLDVTNSWHWYSEKIHNFFDIIIENKEQNAENFSTKALAIKVVLFVIWWSALANERLFWRDWGERGDFGSYNDWINWLIGPNMH